MIKMMKITFKTTIKALNGTTTYSGIVVVERY